MKIQIVRSKTPLRIGLAGGGTDVSPFCDEHGGCALNVTINMYSYCTIVPTTDNKIVFRCPDIGQEVTFDSVPVLKINKKCPLHCGVYNRVVKDFNNDQPLSFVMTTFSDAPGGSGLGTSSAMVVAILKAFQEWLNLPLGEYDTAQLAYEIERKDLGFSGGKQDQYSATFGGLNYMEFTRHGDVVVNPLRLKKWIKNEMETSIILLYTGQSRDSSKIIEAQKESINDEASLKAMMEIKRITNAMKSYILKGEFDGVVNCLKKNWEAKKKTSSAVSNRKIEKIYNIVMSNGAKAARISGAGGGGFMVIWVDPIDRYRLTQIINEKGIGFIKKIDFVEQGAQAWTLYE